MTLTANELKIGNYIILCGVDYNHDNIFPDPEMDSVIDVTIETLKDIEKHCEYYKPIELTPELLEKAGFEFIGTDYLGGWKILKKGAMKLHSGAGGFHFLHGDSITILEYLHELQNLYFALQGEELNIQL